MSAYLLLVIILATIWVASLTFERAAYSKQNFSSLNYSWFVASWFPGAILLALPIYSFPEDFSFESALYIGGLHGLFALGSFLGILSKKRVTRPLRYYPLGSRVVFIFILTGLFAQIINGIDSLASGTMSFSDRLNVTNLANLKSQYQDYEQSKSLLGPLAGLIRYLIGVGQIGIIAFAFGSANKTIVPSRLMKYSFAFLIAASIFNSWFITAGRLGIIITLLFALVPRALKIITPPRKKPRPFRKWFSYFSIAFTLIFGIWYLSTTFLVGRLGNADGLTALYAVHRATIDPRSAPTVKSDPTLQALVFQASYLSNPIPTAAFYFNQPTNNLAGPRWGAINFAQIVAPFRQILGIADPNAGRNNQADVEGPLVQAGYYGGVWSTMLREVLIDFGYWGSLIFFFAFGFTSGKLQTAMRYQPSVPLAVLFSLLRVQMLWSGFHSLFYHQLFGYAFLISLIILAFTTLRSGKKNRSKPAFEDLSNYSQAPHKLL